MNEAYQTGFIKRAQEYGIPAVQANALFKQAETNNHFMNFQSYMPTHAKRQLDPDEVAEIEKAQKTPGRIFTSNADPIHADMGNPTISALGYGTIGAGLGSLLGGAVGNSGTAAGLGAILGGLGGGIVGHQSRSAKNNTLLDYIQRNPKGATRRDMMADPVYQKERDRQMMMQAGFNPYRNPYL